MSKIFQNLLKTHKYLISNQLLSRKLSSNIDDMVSSESRLTDRLLYYMNHNKNKIVQQDDLDDAEILHLLKNSNTLKEFQKYDTQKLLSVFSSLAEGHIIKNKVNLLKFVHILDSECCQRISQLGNREVLNYLNLFMKFLPSTITESKFYKIALEQLINLRTLDQSDLVQVIFFIGLMKKRRNSSAMIKKCMKQFDDNFIHNLTSEELCIICNSAFKTSTKITNKVFLNKILNYLNDNLNLLKDPAIFITLLKTVRHNRYQNDDLLSTISCAIFFNKTLQYYSFPAICHILALYSDYLYYDECLLNLFSARCLELLRDGSYKSETTYLLEQPRLKDIKRLLWCWSNLNFKNFSKSDIEDVILPQIIKRVEAGKGNHDMFSLVEISLYLWMLNYKAYDLIEFCLQKDNLGQIRGRPEESKAQLNLLTSCIFFEDKEFYNKLDLHQFQGNYNTQFQMTKRPLLRRTLKNLKEIAEKLDINKFELNCQIPGLNIIGITGYKKNIYKAVHIEVLDEYTTLKNTENKPTGLMQLKLRLLEEQDEALIVISSEEIEPMDEAELQDVLFDEIHFVC